MLQKFEQFSNFVQEKFDKILAENSENKKQFAKECNNYTFYRILFNLWDSIYYSAPEYFALCDPKVFHREWNHFWKWKDSSENKH